jgi:NAD(P)-dependent dehydrogenase (short-subunit alcohol dehydrogenase family)
MRIVKEGHEDLAVAMEASGKFVAPWCESADNAPVMGRLQDKVIVVIGGTGGLGLSAARAFEREGARVVVVGRSAEGVRRAEEALEGGGAVLAADAMRPETAAEAIRLASDRFGGFDGLYHVAGGSGRRHGDGPLHEITDQGWEQTLHWNLTSLFYSNRAAAQWLLDHDRPGAVLNMSSVLGFSPSPRYFATHAYAASKSAVIGFTRAVAAYYAPRGIRFNVLAPALVDTAMARRAAEDPEIQAFIARKQPLDGGRISRPEDLDEAAVFLMSDGSRAMSGQVVTVDGGWTISDGQERPDGP